MTSALERGEGVLEKWTKRGELSKGGCMKMQRRGEGVKKSKQKLQMSFVHGPLQWIA